MFNVCFQPRQPRLHLCAFPRLPETRGGAALFFFMDGKRVRNRSSNPYCNYGGGERSCVSTTAAVKAVAKPLSGKMILCCTQTLRGQPKKVDSGPPRSDTAFRLHPPRPPVFRERYVTLVAKHRILESDPPPPGSVGLVVGGGGADSGLNSRNS